MLKRKFYQTLLDWRKNKKTECLLVKGARQIGKTFIIDLFGKEQYESYLYINFIESPEYQDVFEGNLSALEIRKRLTLVFPTLRFVDNNTLIFLDEIQVCPNARTALKFLAQDSTIDVIASGSLLGISYREVSSIPVGYETQVTMHALDFEEYLWAIGYEEDAILSLREYYEQKTKVPTSIHDVMMKNMREYAVVGGMPAVVNKFIETKHFGEVHKVQQMILDSYYEDISNYASLTEKPKVKNCYLSIPKQLAKENKKFQFSVVEKKSTARKYENSVEWLRDSNLVHMCHNVSTPSFPLVAYEKEEQYKLYLADVGLLICMYGFEMKKAIIDDSLTGPAKGGIYENLISDILIKRGYHLSYYRNTSGTCEIEFLLTKDSSIIPVEVKAGNNSSNSLNKLLETNNYPYAYKFISGNVGVVEKKITLPFYMAMFV